MGAGVGVGGTSDALAPPRSRQRARVACMRRRPARGMRAGRRLHGLSALPPTPASAHRHSRPAPGVRDAPDALMDAKMTRSWNEGRARPFLATTLDVGWTYLRPRASLGYGRPFGPGSVRRQPDHLGHRPRRVRRAAPRAAALRFARRSTLLRGFNRNYLNPQAQLQPRRSRLHGRRSVARHHLRSRGRGFAPARAGRRRRARQHLVRDRRPEGQLVFEETLHVIVAPPLVWRARGGYAFRFGTHGSTASASSPRSSTSRSATTR